MASREYSDETPRKDNLNEGLESLSLHELNGLRDECARTALALTALFDGEANVEEALLARTHRDECAQCDFLWQSWHHQNQSLRYLSAPVPPALLTAHSNSYSFAVGDATNAGASRSAGDSF